MTKKMLINATHPEENRVAIVEDGILSELDIEIAGKEQARGNIYKANVVRIEPGLQAAFIDYGSERFGFLQMGEIHPSYFRNQENGGENRRPRITDVLRRGQELLVQVVKEERGTKGAALTTFLSLPGRYMVLMPESDTKGVSRKIEDESQRKKLKEAMSSLDPPAGMGYIVRTAGIGQKKEELKRDFDYLVRVYHSIQDQASRTRAPDLIYKESNLAIRSLRDYFSADMDEVLVDDPRVADEAREFFQQVMPEYARLVKLHQERRPIFSRYQIEEQIETIYKNKVQLPSGGSIVIDPTEALVSIDVNSGKMAGEQGVEATAYKTNLEAAAEIARQLRLRDLGGLIVIDFIDMRDRKHIREVEKCLKDSLKSDKARVTVGRISQFGLLEMSRQRIKAALAEGAYLPCPHCGGGGRIKSAEAQGIAFLRKVHAAVAKGQIARVEGEVPLEVATYLLNVKREELLDMERRHQMVLVIKGRPEFLAGQVNLSVFKREKEEFLPDTERVIATLPTLPTALPAPDLPEEKEIAEGVPAPEAAPSDEAAVAEEGGKKKRKRRRKKKKPEEAPSTEETVPEVSPELELEPSTPEDEEETEAGEEAPAEGAATADAGVEERRKKRRRRRRKKPSSTQEEAVQEEAVSAEESLKSQDAAPEIAEPQEPKEPKEPEPPVEPAEQTEEIKAARPRRRTRRKPASAAHVQDEAASETPGIPAAVEEPPATVGVETVAAEGSEKKPKRRTTRSTPTKKNAPGDEIAAKEDAATEEADKPKRKRRQAAKGETAEEPSGSQEAESGDDAEKPKKRTRRTPRKTTESIAEE